MSEVSQDYYDDEIIVFTDNEEVPIYDKLKESYEQLGDVCTDTIKRGRDKSENAIGGRRMRSRLENLGLKTKMFQMMGIRYLYRIFLVQRRGLLQVLEEI